MRNSQRLNLSERELVALYYHSGMSMRDTNCSISESEYARVGKTSRWNASRNTGTPYLDEGVMN